MLPSPQDFAQLADTSRLPVLDRIITALPEAALVFIIAAAVAVAWMCWNERHPHAPHMRHRSV